MAKLNQLSHYGPSICVKFYKNYVLAGYGVFIHVYDYSNGKLINISRIFHMNKVHGIAIKNEKVLVYGSRSVSFLPLTFLVENADNTNLEKLCDEWVVSGEHSADGSTLYLLTSYNKVLCCDHSFNVLQRKAVFGERSILYSGTITVYSQDKVHINAGTVMDGVIVWDLESEQNLHHFTDHEGAIFFVTASKNGKYAASCSDDRSIKLWDLKSGQLLSTAWGHTARIWNLLFFDNDSKVISVSEDCTCRVWDISEDNTLSQASVHEVHLLKSVWGLDVDNERMIAATSGNDGRIKLTDLKAKSRVGDETMSFSLEDIEAAGVAMKPKEIIKGFHWFKFGLIAMTSEGQVLKFEQSSKKWSSILNDSTFSNYSITAGLQELNLIVFCSSQCDLLVIKFNDDGTEILQKEYVHIKELSKTTNCLVDVSGTQVFIALESPNPKDPVFCLQINGESLSVEKADALEKPTNFVISCILFHNGYLLMGSRFSTIAVFDLSDSNKAPVVLRRLLPGDTITSIKFVEEATEDSLFSVTDRDGHYCFLSLQLGTEKHEIVLQNNISKGFLEGAYFDEFGDFITFGFKSNIFFVFNETKQYEIMSELCGGAHRHWRLIHNSTSADLILIYVKASCIHVRKLHKKTTPHVLRNGIHGREIRDLSIRKTPYLSNKYLFCSASEDTTVKLNALNKDTGDCNTIWTFRKHTSGLQRCKFLNNNLMITSAAREELFLWKLTDRYASNPYMKILCVLPSSSDHPDLRIMDFDFKFVDGCDDFLLTTVYSDSSIKVWYYSHHKNEFWLVASDRYQTCCILNVAFIALKHHLMLLVSPTDGHLVCWDVTKLVQVPYENYELKKPIESHSVQRFPDMSNSLPVHRAGIKCLSTRVTGDDSFSVYTGGDDNAVAISEFVLDTQNGRLVSKVAALERSGASSTITSLIAVDNGKQFLTSSVDQNVRCYDPADNKLELKDKIYTTNADTCCIEVLPTLSGTLVLIGGVGLSVWNLDHGP